MTQTSDLAAARAAATARMSAPPAPARLGNWELVRPLGEGPLTIVHLARPAGAPSGQPAYIVKLLAPRWQSDPRGLEMLRRVTQVGRSISHPHLVPVLAAELREPPYYVVMPRLAGWTLAEQLERVGRPSLPTALWIARQVAEALLALESAGWMHADVKPANIVISPDGHATLIDLGFARRLDEMASLATRPILGTPNYLAPEMLSATMGADIRSDVYSLGVTLFETLTGRLPQGSDDAAALAERWRHAAPANPHRAAPQLPLRAVRLLRQMLARQPIRRPGPSELVDRLCALEIETFAERPLEDFATSVACV